MALEASGGPFDWVIMGLKLRYGCIIVGDKPS